MDNSRVENLIAMADDCLKASKLLYENNLYSSSVNRSYYAMFDAARALLVNIDIEYKTHKSIITAFSKEYILTNKISSIQSKRFVRAFENRMHSDYDYGHNATQQDAFEILNNAEDFIHEIMSYLRKIDKIK